jgi:hypothetical protein
MFSPVTVQFSGATPSYTFPVQRVTACGGGCGGVCSVRGPCATLDVGFVGTLEVPGTVPGTFTQRFRVQLLVDKIYGESVLEPETGITNLAATPLVQVTDAAPITTLVTRYVGPLTSGGFNVHVTVLALDPPTADFEVRLSGALTLLVLHQ